MSSSPPPLVPSLASDTRPSSSSSSSSHGSSAPARVSPLPVSGLFQALRVHDSPPLGGSSPPSQAAGAPGPSLNPFAREFVPGCSAAPSSSEGFLARSNSGEVVLNASELCVFGSSSPPEVGTERLNGALLDGDQCVAVESTNSNSQRSGGLSTAFKRGHAGESKTLVAARGGQIRHGGSDGMPNQTGASTSALGKRGQFSSANHLLNFHYDPILRAPPPARAASSRRSHRTQPYNKELFLQANFRFLVSDFGDYLLNSSDPDRMLQWEDIAAVNVSAPMPIQCPICLETPPVCPQITSCGHIFCFPCILRYLIMGEDEQKSDFFKKCPLCFAMISSKMLWTVFIDDVHNYQVGDYADFTLLNRAKGSTIPYEKNDPVVGTLPYSKDGLCHPFSKFTLTSDAEHTANKATADLSSWADRAQKEAGEDMELLPFVFAAIDHLQQRKTAWEEHRASEFLSSSPTVRQRIIAQTKEGPASFSGPGSELLDMDDSTTEVAKSTLQKIQGREAGITAETEAAMADLKDRAGWVYESAFSDEEDDCDSRKSRSMKSKRGATQSDAQSHAHQDIPKHSKVPARPVHVPSSWEENLSVDAHSAEKPENASDLDRHAQHDFKKDTEDRDSYAYYQSADGQPLILHPLNMKCLLHHYGSYDSLPSRLQGRIVEMEGQIQTEATRKRFRYLSHLPLTTNFQLCEMDIWGVLPSSAFAPFIEEIRIRENRRRRRLKQEQAERFKEERLSASQYRYSPSSDVMTLMDDVHEEELPPGLGLEGNKGDAIMMPSSPVLDQRKLFSQVTRLGFASAHDAPDLQSSKNVNSSFSGASISNQFTNDSSNTSAPKESSMSFADIIQAQPSNPAQNASNGSSATTQSSSKKNRKAAKLLLSTGGGRRY